MQDLNELAIEWNEGGLSRKRERLILKACFNRYWKSANSQAYGANMCDREEIFADYYMNILDALNTWSTTGHKYKRFETYMYQCIKYTGGAFFRKNNKVANKRTTTYGMEDITRIQDSAPVMWDDYKIFSYDKDKSKC